MHCYIYTVDKNIIIVIVITIIIVFIIIIIIIVIIIIIMYQTSTFGGWITAAWELYFQDDVFLQWKCSERYPMCLQQWHQLRWQKVKSHVFNTYTPAGALQMMSKSNDNEDHTEYCIMHFPHTFLPASL